jgi:hypothetical protein
MTDIASVTSSGSTLLISSLTPVDDTNVVTLSSIPTDNNDAGVKAWFSFRTPLVTAAHKSFAALIGD